MSVPSGIGRPDAPILIVGECWGEREEQARAPFVGPSGQELNRMLAEAGILRSDCYVTNLVNARPPRNDLDAWIPLKKKDITSNMRKLRDRFVAPIVLEGYESLRREIDLLKPKVILALGNSALWALTGASGIQKWRGSLMHLDGGQSGIRVIPTFHPAAIMRMWDWRAPAVRDLRRAKQELEGLTPRPSWKFIVRPSLHVTMQTLNSLLDRAAGGALWIDIDIETRAGHIACVGLSWSKVDAICIPLMQVGDRGGYWATDEEEGLMLHRMYRLLTHPNVRGRLQNGLYDAQYFYRHWHYIPNVAQDTMISHHTMFAALPKSLAFQASQYANYYFYWKDEGKTWQEAMSEEQLWAYNCQDCVYTRECGEVEQETVKKLGLEEVEAFQQSMFDPVLRAMLRGVRMIPEKRLQMSRELEAELQSREQFLGRLLGHKINVASPKQMQALFYADLEQKPVLKKTLVKGVGMVYRPSCDDESLNTLKQKEPILTSLCNAIADMRTLKKWKNDFVEMKLDTDGRMRCSFNIAGDAQARSAPYSYRLSSSESAFGSGGNLQTIPSDKSKSAGKAKQRGTLGYLPNIRQMFGPDPGHTFFDMDLDRADLQVVVWEAEDEMLKAALHLGADVHLLNVYGIDGQEAPPLEELVESHPKYLDHRGPRKHKREFAKVFCHATNYLGKAPTVAAHTGRTIHEIDRAQKAWFGAHPGILRWHQRVIEQVQKRRYVENRFGYRWYIFDRIDEQLYPKAVSWVPQSTVGGVINRVWRRLYDEARWIEVLLQVHDSLAGQFPTSRHVEAVEALERCGRIVIPYEDPLVIPVGVSTSTVSWGDCT